MHIADVTGHLGSPMPSLENKFRRFTRPYKGYFHEPRSVEE